MSSEGSSFWLPKRVISRILVLLASAVTFALLSSSCITPSFVIEEDGGVASGAEGGQLNAHCSDRRRNFDETDVDCGGTNCSRCADSRVCALDRDCENRSCIGRRCQEPSCVDDQVNGTETDLNCGGNQCSPCADGLKCVRGSDCASQVCQSGVCVAPNCSDRVKNGNETDVDCGGQDCEQRCDSGRGCSRDNDCLQSDDVESACGEDDRCFLRCPRGQGDCNRMATDGCEVDLHTLDNCGACGAECAPPHALGALCSTGTCRIDTTLGENNGCEDEYVDCNGEVSDGCEAHLPSDIANCSACGIKCSNQNGMPSCNDGACAIECDGGFRDCDGDPTSNGCEVNINTSTSNCGGCGPDFACDQAGPGQVAVCTNGVCSYKSCDAGFGPCDGDGLCDDPLNTAANCGACGDTCVAENANPSCLVDGGAFTCAIGSCRSGYADCDQDYTTGCEINTRSNKGRCGGCLADDPRPGEGIDCQEIEDDPSLRIGAAGCSSGRCTVVSCTSPYEDCNDDARDGCEAGTTTSANRCGGCLPTDPRSGSGVVCDTSQSAHVTANPCVSGLCNPTCASDYRSCDGVAANGCETNIRTNKEHCGGCNVVCGGSAQLNVNSATCQSGGCAVSCQNNLCPDLSNPERPCTMGLGTVQHCQSCGNTCTAPAGAVAYCDGAAGCKQRFPVTLVGTASGASIDTNTTTITYNLQTPSGNNRMLLVAVAAGGPSTVRYNNVDMIQAVTQKAGTESGYASIYYMLDNALGSTGNKTITVAPGWGGSVVAVMELRNAVQGAPSDTTTVWESGCSSDNAISGEAAVSLPTSFVAASLLAQGPQGTATSSGLTQLYGTWRQAVTGGYHGYITNAASNRTVGWGGITNCYAKALVTVTISPVILP